MYKWVAIELFGPMAMDKCWGGPHILCDPRTLKPYFLVGRVGQQLKPPPHNTRLMLDIWSSLSFWKALEKAIVENKPKNYSILDFCFGYYVDHLNISRAFKNSKTRFGGVGHQLRPPFYLYGTSFEPQRGKFQSPFKPFEGCNKSLSMRLRNINE